MKVEILDMIVRGDDGVIGRSSGKGYSVIGDKEEVNGWNNGNGDMDEVIVLDSESADMVNKYKEEYYEEQHNEKVTRLSKIFSESMTMADIGGTKQALSDRDKLSDLLGTQKRFLTGTV